MTESAEMPASERDAGPIVGIILTCVPVMIVAALMSMIPIQPEVIHAFGGQPHISQLVSLATVLPTLAIAVTSPAAGLVGDWIDRRRLLLVSAGVFAVSAPIPALLNAFTLILVARGVAGLALGFMLTCSVALIGDYYSGRKLRRWLAAQTAVGSLSAVFIAAFSGTLGEINWRYAFLSNLVGVFLFSALVFVRWPKTSTVNEGHRTHDRDSGGAVPWLAWLSVFSVTVVGTAIIFPQAYELGVLLQEKALGAALLTGLTTSVLAGGAVAGAICLGLLRRLPTPSIAALSVAFSGAGTLLIVVATNLPLMMAGAGLVGFGQGMLGPVTATWLLERTPERLRGRAVGAFQTLVYLALFVGPLTARSLALALHSSIAAMRCYAMADAVFVVLMVFTLVRRPVGSAGPTQPMPTRAEETTGL